MSESRKPLSRKARLRILKPWRCATTRDGRRCFLPVAHLGDHQVVIGVTPDVGDQSGGWDFDTFPQEAAQ